MRDDEALARARDAWLEPPEDDKPKELLCSKCYAPIFVDVGYYELDDQIYCEHCVEKAWCLNV